MMSLRRKFAALDLRPRWIASVGAHRLASTLGYRHAARLGWQSPPPETVNLYPTLRCNLRCAMCFARFMHSPNELPPRWWTGLIRRMHAFAPRLHLSGGEPLLYPGIDELLAAIGRGEFLCHLTTNATLLEEHAAEIVQARVSRVDVSLDGPEYIHDRIRGVAGTYRKALRGMARIASLRGGRRIPGIRVNSILNCQEPQAMVELIRTAAEYRVESVQFIHTMFVSAPDREAHAACLRETIGRELNYWKRADTVAPAGCDAGAVQNALVVLRHQWPVRVTVFPDFSTDDLASYYAGGRGRVEGRSCRAMWNTLTVLPNGDVESCPDYVVGNCRNRDVMELWNGAAMRNLRQRIRKRDFFAVCRACCFYYQ